MSNKVLSIDIGNKNIKMIVAKNKGKNLIIYKAVMFATPPNSFQDGKIINKESLKNEIIKILHEHKIGTKRVIITTESTSIITREVVLPANKEEDIKDMIKYELEQYLPVNLDEFIIESKVIERFTSENMKKFKVLTAMMPRSMAESYLSLVKDLRLKPVALDINSNVVSKLFKASQNISGENYSLDRTVAFIDMGYSNLNLNIISNGINQLNRIIEVGGKNIDINIANYFNLTLDEGEKKKIEDSDVNRNREGLNGEEQPSSIALNEIVQSSIDIWLKEIERIFQYYRTRSSGNRIDKIVIYGGNSGIRGLSEYIGSYYDIPTSRVEDIGNIKRHKKIGDIELHYYINCIGATIRA